MKEKIHTLLEIFNVKNITEPVKHVMKMGITISFILLLYSSLLLSLYIEFNTPNYLYEIGSTLFKTFSLFITFFFIYGISFNKIANDFGITKR